MWDADSPRPSASTRTWLRATSALDSKREQAAGIPCCTRPAAGASLSVSGPATACTSSTPTWARKTSGPFSIRWSSLAYPVSASSGPCQLEACPGRFVPLEISPTRWTALSLMPSGRFSPDLAPRPRRSSSFRFSFLAGRSLKVPCARYSPTGSGAVRGSSTKRPPTGGQHPGNPQPLKEREPFEGVVLPPGERGNPEVQDGPDSCQASQVSAGCPIAPACKVLHQRAIRHNGQTAFPQVTAKCPSARTCKATPVDKTDCVENSTPRLGTKGSRDAGQQREDAMTAQHSSPHLTRAERERSHPAASRARVMRGQDQGNGAPTGRTAVGQLVRELRMAAGLSERALARRSAVARSTITRLEHAEIRPRPSLLSAISVGLDPDRPKELRERLTAAAGDDLAPESDRWRRYRQRRLERGILAGNVPLPTDLTRRLRLHREADQAWHEGMAVLRRPGALDDVIALDDANRLLKQARALRDQAGSPIKLHIGKTVISAGFSVP